MKSKSTILLVGVLCWWTAKTHAAPANDNFVEDLAISGTNATVIVPDVGTTQEPAQSVSPVNVSFRGNWW